MKHVILHSFFMLYLCNIKICLTIKRHRFRSGHYDINGFISQLLESSKFDELAEKLAEKAASKIMHNMKEDQAPVGRANDANEVQNNTESTTQNTPIYSEEKLGKSSAHLRKGFAGKIDLQAVMNETTSLSKNLMLKYKLLKKNALEKKNKNQTEALSKNVTYEDRKDNKTTGPADNENKKKEGQLSNQNATQQNKDDIKNKLFDENKSLRDDRKDDDHKEEPKKNTEPNRFHSGADGERDERGTKNDQQPEDPSRDENEKNFRVEQNSGAKVKEEEARQLNIGIKKEEIPSSLDEQNRKYSPSEENINAEPEVERTEDEPQKRGTEESIEVGHARPYFRGREGSVEENIVPSRFNKPNAYGGIDRSIGSNNSGDSGSHEQSSQLQDPAKPVIRREGDKVYTYNQAPEYQEYHEEMAEWRKEHPENPADFL